MTIDFSCHITSFLEVLHSIRETVQAGDIEFSR